LFVHRGIVAEFNQVLIAEREFLSKNDIFQIMVGVDEYAA
jgi:hypothetical protein